MLRYWHTAKSVVPLWCNHILAICLFHSKIRDAILFHAKGNAIMTTTTDELSVVTPADWVPGPPQGSWTYDDYAALPDDGNRYEIVNGVLIWYN